MQCQLFCTKRAYCDFVVWTNSEVHTERIYPDEEFWLKSLDAVKHVYTTAILPELLGKFYTRPCTRDIQASAPSTSDKPTTYVNPQQNPQPSSAKPTTVVYCYCRGPEEGRMVGCDNSKCKYEWFHLTCLGLKVEPKSKHWYCPDCRILPQFQTKRKKK